MRCEQISEYLSAYVENDLEPGLRLNVDQHLETCDTCRADLSALETMFSILDEPTLMVEPPGALADNVMRRLRTEHLEARRSPVGWFLSLSRGWQTATTGAGVLALLAVVMALGPLQSGITGSLGGRLPWSKQNTSAPVAPAVSVAGTTGGFRTAGVPDDLLLDVTAPHAGPWSMLVRTSPGMSVNGLAPADAQGTVSVWQGDLIAGETQRVPVHLQPSGPGAVHEVTVRVSGQNSAEATTMVVLVPVQTAPAPGSPLQWRTAQPSTLRQALASLAAYRGAPISAPVEALDQPVTVNASGINAEDMVDAVAAAASLRVDRTQGACNLRK